MKLSKFNDLENQIRGGKYWEELKGKKKQKKKKTQNSTKISKNLENERHESKSAVY